MNRGHYSAAPPFATSILPPQHTLQDLQGYLTEPSADDPLAIATRYMTANAERLGLTPADLAHVIVTDRYTDADPQVTHLYLRQEYKGLEVSDANFVVNVTGDGRVINVAGGFVPGLNGTHSQTLLAAAAQPVQPGWTATAALQAIAEPLGLTPATTIVQAADAGNFAGGGDQATVLVDKSLSLDPIPARLHYVPAPGGGVVLAWDFVLRTPDGEHWYDASADAATGALVRASDWVDSATYNVYARPVESPTDGVRTLLTDPHDVAASPYGWHDTNGVAGADFTDTRGNNVYAQEDVDASNSGGFRPDGSASLTFDFPLDLVQAPSTYQSEAITNLFYWNNLIHDVHYTYGFTEAAGNFQQNNYGRGGLGNDAVQADAQDGSGTNNANFYTPPDGSPGRMQMFIFTLTSPYRDGDLDNQIIVHEYGHGVSNRLVGGPANANALDAQQSGGMGEGWSDWWGLMFTQKSTDTKLGSYRVGTYVLGQTPTGAGIRRYPYSYNMAVDPLTYGDFRINSEVHDAGEVWCAALWDMNWLLIDKHGFNANIATGYGAGGAGNLLALKLVEDSLKLMPANPTFLQGRDAVLLADRNLTSSANQAEIWAAFARRGMGYSAYDGGNANSINVTEAFDLPGMRVTSQTPTGVMGTAQSTIDFTFAKNILQSSFAVADDVVSFTGPGSTDLLSQITGSSFPANNILRLTFNSQTAQGLYTIVIGPNILAADNSAAMDQNANGTAGQVPEDRYTGTFRYDTLTLQVTSTTPANGGVLAVTGATTPLTLTFNEPYDPASLGTGDLTLSQGTITGVHVVDATSAVYDVSGITSETTLTVTLAAGAVTDTYGNPGAAWSGSYQIDIGTGSLPTLTAKNPLGSLVYEGSTSGTVSTAADTDSYTIALDAGQSLTGFLAPASGLQPVLTMTDPGGSTLGTATAVATGKQALVQTVAVSTAGTYTLTVASAGGTSGSYTLQVELNAAVEAEGHDGATNDTLATAQSLDPALVAVGSGQRAAALGTLPLASGTPVISETFDAGPPLGAAWSTYSSQTTGRIQVTGTYGTASGADALIMDNNDSNGSTYNLNEAIWTVNLTGIAQPSLVFSYADWNDDISGFGGDFTGHYNADGIAISADSVTWHPVWTAVNQTEGVWQQYTLNLATLATTHGITLGNNFKIKFQQYDNYDINTDGIGFDQLAITTPATAEDWYSFGLAANQSATVGLAALTAGSPTLRLYDSGSQLLARGVTATNLTQVINNFVAPAAGTYYARVSGTDASYNLVLIEGIGFDTEANDSFSTAQELTRTGGTLGYLSGTSDAGDYYRFPVNAGDTLTLSTVTPADGSNQFANTLNPKLDLYNPSGALVANNDNGAADGRNALLTYTALATGSYAVRVAAAANSGEYAVSIQGATGSLPAFSVTGTAPANGIRVITAPTTIIVVFNDQVAFSSVQNADLLIDGVPDSSGTAPSLADGKTVVFTIPAGLGQGTHTVALAAGSVTDLQNTPLAAYSGTFVVDGIPPHVTASSVIENNVLAPGALTYTATFDEDMNTTVLDSTDFSLVGAVYGARTATSSSWTDARHLQLQYASLPEDNYTLTLLSASTRFQDLTGNLLDGEPHTPFSLPSGNGTAGGNFVVHFSVDVTTAAFSVLTSKNPLGSLVYEGNGTGVVNNTSDTDSFTLALDAGQSLTAFVVPATGLQPVVTITGPSGTLGTATASAAGKQAVVQTVAVATAGTYTLTVTATGSTSGSYTLQAELNADVEAEIHDGATNDTPATAQSLDAAFVALAASGQRAAVLGTGDYPRQSFLSWTMDTDPGWTYQGQWAWGQPTGTSGDPSSGHTGTKVVGYNLSGTYPDNMPVYYATTPAFSTLGKTSVQLSFWHWLGVENNSWDDATINVSRNGTTWTNVWANGTSTITETAWSQQTYDISAVADNQAQVFLRFGMGPTDSSVTYCGWNIDDVSLTSLVQYPDYYSVTLAAGQSATVGLTSLATDTPTLELYDSGANLLATGTTSTNVSRIINNFVAPAAGTYSVRVTGLGVAYDLVVTTDLAFDTEANDTFATAQPLSSTNGALGYLSGTSDTGDYYSFPATVGAPLVVTTGTPADGANQFTNTLNPKVELYNPSGTLVASDDNGAVDGRNARLSYTALVTGNYVARVQSAANSGEYLLSVGQASVTVTPTAGLTTTESGGTAAFTVVLGSPPKADVTIGLSSSDLSEGTVSPASLTFTAANWNVPQPATVTGVNDPDVDGDVAYTIVTAPATSSDLSYLGLDPADVGATNLDNELVLTLTPTSGSVSEYGGSTTVTVTRTNAVLTAPLTLTLTSSDTTEATVPATVTIPANQASATFPLTAVDDTLLDGTQTVTITASTGYILGSTTVDVTDYETLTVTINPGSMSEHGGTATGTVTRNNTDLGAALTVSLDSDDTSEAIVPATVTIPANEASATFTVTAADDVVLDGSQTVTIGAGAGGYQAGTTQVLVTDLENPPTVTAPIPDASVAEDAADTVIGLGPVFDDPDVAHGDALTYTASVTPLVAGLVSQVNQASYTSLHQDLLYTHTGNNRGVYGAQHDLARENIYSYFAGLGLQTTLEPFVYNSQTYYNVVAVQPGLSRPNDVYLVGAHYDSVNNPGADDNASGTAGVLELARVLSQYSFDATLAFVAFDREEQGLWGSSAYVAAHDPTKIKGMLSLDMIAYNPAGAAHDKVLLYDGNGSGAIKSALATAFATYGAGLTTSDQGSSSASDHYPFDIAGADAALIIEGAVWSNPYYHQATDAVESAGYLDYAYATKVAGGALGYLATAAGLQGPSSLVTATVNGSTLSLDYGANVGGMAAVRVRATDTQAQDAEDEFTVTVTAVNDAPALDNSGSMSLAAINEDAVSTSGTLVRDILASAGGDRITDADVGALEGIAVTSADNSHGTWQYSLQGGSVWNALGSPTATAARLLGSDAGTRIRFVPAADWSGQLDPGLTFRAWDHTFGSNGGTVDASTGGGATAFSTALETAAITVVNVNDPPTGSVTIDDTTPVEGQLLTAAHTLADADGLGPIAYTWQRADNAAFNTGVVTVGTGSAFMPGAAELGKYLRVTAGYTDGQGTAESVSSAVTAAVGPGLVVSTTTLAVTEGASNTFSVRLAAQPLSDVTVTVARTAGDADLSVSGGASLTFTSGNWSTPQPVTIAAAEDADAANGSAPITVSSAGLTAQTVTASELDNDTQALVVSTTTLPVGEDASNSFTVRLAAQPLSEVTVTVARTAGDADLSVSGGASLTFTSGNWSTPQPVTIAAAEDADAANGSAPIMVSSAGLTAQTVTASEVDNDTQTLVVSTTALAVGEGASNSFTVRLAAQPPSDVTVTVARTAGDADLSVSGGASLTFTSGNWSTPQPVTIAAAEDADAANGSAPIMVSSAGLTAQTVTASEVDNDTLPAKFDFNGASGDTAAGYTGVRGSETYTAARGYGWLATALEFERSGPNALQRDGHYGSGSTGNTFQMAVDPAKQYDVKVYVGDSYAHNPRLDGIQVTVEGTTTYTISSLAAGVFDSRTTSAPLSASADGLLNVTIRDGGGANIYWVINGLELTPLSTVAPLTITGPGGTLIAEGTTVDTFTVTGAATGSLYTVATTLGTVTSADADAGRAGIQIQAAGSSFTFQVRRPATAGTATLSAVEVNNAASGSLSQVYQSATPSLPTTFDFNGAGNDTAAGFTGVRTSDTYTVARGYGWLAAPSAFERSGPNSLQRDGHYGTGSTGNTFQMAVDPTKQYDVKVYVGDSYAHNPRLDGIQVTVEGATAYTISSLAAGVFDSRTTTAPLSAAADGLLSVTIRDGGGANIYWVINGIELTPVTAGVSLTINGPGGTLVADGITVDAFAVTGTTTGSLYTVATTLGTVTSADADAGRAGIRIQAAGSSFTYQVRRPATAGTATLSAVEVNNTASGSLSQVYQSATPSLPATFDFNGAGNDTAAGFTGVRTSDTYTVARGYGWLAAPSAFERSGPNSLQRDGHYGTGSTGNTFQMAVDPTKQYDVKVYVGDSYAHNPRLDGIQVTVEGTTTYTISSLAAGVFDSRTTTAPLSASADGLLNVTIRDGGGANIYWVINGLELTPLSTVAPLTITGPGGTLIAEGTTVDTFTVTGAATGSLYTVASTLGTVTSADADAGRAGIRIQAAGSSFTFQVRRPATAGTATLSAVEVNNAASGSLSQVYQSAGPPAIQRFDFNGTSSDTATGFTGVRTSDTYTVARGYGWSTAPLAFERTGPSSLRRDGHYGSGATGNTFSVAVNSTKQYNVRVYVGDSYAHSAPLDAIQVTVEGATAYTIGPLAAGSFDAQTTAAGATAAADGALTVTIKDLGGANPYWVINGIDVWETTTAAPGVQALRAGRSPASRVQSPEPGSGLGVTPALDPRLSTLDSAQLAPVVEQAMGIWTATGLSPAQVAWLRATPVAIANLDAQGYLGLTTPERILIDDDGAGLGWSVPSGSGLSTLDSRLSYDLLTTVLHEMGHVLGRADAASSDLMGAILQPGERHLPDVDDVFAGW